MPGPVTGPRPSGWETLVYMTVTRESSLRFKTGMLQGLENYRVTYKGRESGNPPDNPISLTCGSHHHSIILGHKSYNQLVSWKVPFLWSNSIFCYLFYLPSPHSMLSFVLKIFNLTSSHHITTGDVAGEFHCGPLKTKSSFHLTADQILHFTGLVVPHYAKCDFYVYFVLLRDTVSRSGYIQWVSVKTAFRVLSLRKQTRLEHLEDSCKYVEWAVKVIKKGGRLLAWGFSQGIPTPHLKCSTCEEMLNRVSDVCVRASCIEMTRVTNLMQ